MKIIIALLAIAASLLVIPSANATTEPTCAAGEEWQGEFGCIAVQLPEEHVGGQIDCPDGSIGTVIDAAGTVRCGDVAPPPVVEIPAPVAPPVVVTPPAAPTSPTPKPSGCG